MRKPPDPEAVRRLLEDLDHDDYAAREQATQGLAEMSVYVEPALREALRGDSSPEVKTRIGALLRAMEYPYRTFPNEYVRRTRAIRILERMGTESARAILEDLVDASPSLRERELSKAAVRRMTLKTSTEESAPPRTP